VSTGREGYNGPGGRRKGVSITKYKSLGEKGASNILRIQQSQKKKRGLTTSVRRRPPSKVVESTRCGCFLREEGGVIGKG